MEGGAKLLLVAKHIGEREKRNVSSLDDLRPYRQRGNWCGT
jgi:hypothetical protein